MSYPQPQPQPYAPNFPPQGAGGNPPYPVPDQGQGGYAPPPGIGYAPPAQGPGYGPPGQGGYGQPQVSTAL